MIGSLPRSAVSSKLRLSKSARRVPPPQAAFQFAGESKANRASPTAPSREYFLRALEVAEAEMAEVTPRPTHTNTTSMAQSDGGFGRNNVSSDDDDDVFHPMDTLCICSYDEDD